MEAYTHPEFSNGLERSLNAAAREVFNSLSDSEIYEWEWENPQDFKDVQQRKKKEQG